MSSKSTKQTTNQTVTPTNPQWVTDALQGYSQRVQQFGQKDPTTLVAPSSDLQNKAFAAAGGMSGSPLFGEAAGIARGAVNSGSPQDFMSPYTEQVVDTTLQGYDQDAGRQRAALAARGAANKGFGGSRFGVAEGMLGGQLAQGRAGAEAQLRDQAYNTGMGYYGDAQGRNLQAGGLLSNIGSAEDANTRSNVGLMAGLGETQRGIDADYRTADLSMLQALGALNSQNQFGLFQGSNTKGMTVNKAEPSKTEQAGQAIQIAASLAKLFSDRRLKRNIVPLGQGWYAYNYLWSDDVEVGVMADEQPQAASVGPGGFLVVDYGAL